MFYNQIVSAIFRDALLKLNTVENSSAQIHELCHLASTLKQHGLPVMPGAEVHADDIEYCMQVPDADAYEHVCEILRLMDHELGPDLLSLDKVGCRVNPGQCAPQFHLFYPSFANHMEAAHA